MSATVCGGGQEVPDSDTTTSGDIAPYHARKREIIGTYSLGDIGQSNLFGYAGVEINLGNWMINPSVRVDWFHFNYAEKTAAEYTDPGVGQAL